MSKKKWLLAIILIAVALYFVGPHVPYIGSYLGLFRYYVDLGLVFVGGIFAGSFSAYPVPTVTGVAGLGITIIGVVKKWYSDAKATISGLTQQAQQTAEDANSVIGRLQTDNTTLLQDNVNLETKLTSALDGNKIITDLQTQNTQLQKKIQELQSDYNAVIRTAAVKVSIPTEPARIN